MTNLKNTYSLQAFPTEKIFKEFKPVRGFVVQGTLELSPDQTIKLATARRNQGDDPLAWKEPIIEPDLGPLLKAIAERFGYDVRLLTEGKGETGLAEHSWVAYAHDGGCPALVRWQADQGQLLLSIGVSPSSGLTVTILADQAGVPTLLRVGDILSGLQEDGTAQVDLAVPVGDTLQQVALTAPTTDSVFGPSLEIFLPAGHELNALRRRELERLAYAIPVKLSMAQTVGWADAQKPLAPNGLRMNNIFQGALDFGPDEPLSAAIMEQVLGVGIDLATGLMEHAIAKAFAPPATEKFFDDLCLDREKELLDVELAERRDKLPQLTRLADRLPGIAGRTSLSFGLDVPRTPGEVLRGTRPVAKIVGGDLTAGDDLLDILFEQMRMVWRRVGGGRPGKGQPKLRLSGQVHLPGLADLHRDAATCRQRIEELGQPYYGTHLGLPVRIDQRLIVWRDGDAQALAADFFHLPATGDTHFTHLQRVKIPGS